MGLGQATMGQALQNQQSLQSAGQQQAGLGSQAAALATGDMQALGQVAQSQGALAQSQMSPFQQALQANMQVHKLYHSLVHNSLEYLVALEISNNSTHKQD